MTAEGYGDEKSGRHLAFHTNIGEWGLGWESLLDGGPIPYKFRGEGRCETEGADSITRVTIRWICERGRYIDRLSAFDPGLSPRGANKDQEVAHYFANARACPGQEAIIWASTNTNKNLTLAKSRFLITKLGTFTLDWPSLIDERNPSIQAR